MGWLSTYGSGKGGDAITSGLEVTWTTTPTQWSNDYFDNLFGFDWELTKSPAGAHQWTPKNGAGAGTVPDAHDPSKRHAPADADHATSRCAWTRPMRRSRAGSTRTPTSSPMPLPAPGSS